MIHQSDLSGLVGQFGCLERFKRRKTDAALGVETRRDMAPGKMCAGSAVHAVLHRILGNPRAARELLTNGNAFFSRAQLERAYLEEFNRARGGRVVEWGKEKSERVHEESIDMLSGVLADLPTRAEEIIATEVGFVFHLDGIWMTGACDVIYRPRGSSRLALADWKTGKTKPHTIELDHGWQSAIYSEAMKRGYFVRWDRVERHAREGESHRVTLERVCARIAAAWESARKLEEEHLSARGEVVAGELFNDLDQALAELDRVVEDVGAERFDEFPVAIHYVHLRDFLPYQRKTTRMVQGRDDLAWQGLSEPRKVTFEKGDRRGPAWLAVQRSEADAPRLLHLLRAVVAWVRFGRFPAIPGEKCSRCRYREPCLLDGYKPTGDAAKQLSQITRRLDFDGFGGVDDI